MIDGIRQLVKWNMTFFGTHMMSVNCRSQTDVAACASSNTRVRSSSFAGELITFVLLSSCAPG